MQSSGVSATGGCLSIEVNGKDSQDFQKCLLYMLLRGVSVH